MNAQNFDYWAESNIRNWMPQLTRRYIYSYMHICIVYDDTYTYTYRRGLSSLVGWMRKGVDYWAESNIKELDAATY